MARYKNLIAALLLASLAQAASAADATDPTGASNATGATGAEKETGDLDTLVGEQLRERLVGKQPMDFVEPPWAEQPEDTASVRTDGGDSKKLSVSAGLLLASAEHGAAVDIAESAGTGTEIRLGYGAPDRWALSLSLSQTSEGLLSEIDGTESTATRYLFGTGRAWRLGKSLMLGAGGGLAWTALDVEDPEPDRDIEGLGGYLEVRLSVVFGNIDFGVSGRALAWQGTDGFGNSGSEFSTTLGADVGLRF